MNNINNSIDAKDHDHLYNDIYVISLMNPSNATVIACRHADNFLDIGENVFSQKFMDAEESRLLYRKIYANEDNLILTSIGNRLAFISTQLIYPLNCVTAIFPRLPYDIMLSLIEFNNIGEFDIFESVKNANYKYPVPYEYKFEDVYRLLNKLLMKINACRYTPRTAFNTNKSSTFYADTIIHKIHSATDLVGCKLNVEETTIKPYKMLNLNLCALCAYTFCVFMLARRLSATYSATLSIQEQSDMVFFVYTIDCYKSPAWDSFSSKIFLTGNYPELVHCKKSANFNNCIFNYKTVNTNNAKKLIISICTDIPDNSNFGLKSSF